MACAVKPRKRNRSSGAEEEQAPHTARQFRCAGQQSHPPRHGKLVHAAYSFSVKALRARVFRIGTESVEIHPHLLVWGRGRVVESVLHAWPVIADDRARV